MTVIEHEINWCDTFECDGPVDEDPQEPGTCVECGQLLVRMKVVRADQLAGAVSALRELTEVAELYAPPIAATSDTADRWRAAVRKARTIVGGQ